MVRRSGEKIVPLLCPVGSGGGAVQYEIPSNREKFARRS